MFDIESTSTITERKVGSSPIASILFVRSSSYPAVRTGTGAGAGAGAGAGSMYERTASSPSSSYGFPSTRAMALAMDRDSMGNMSGADRGMADMFDMSSPIKMKQREQETEKSKIINSTAARLLLFTAGEEHTYTPILLSSSSFSTFHYSMKNLHFFMDSPSSSLLISGTHT